MFQERHILFRPRARRSPRPNLGVYVERTTERTTDRGGASWSSLWSGWGRTNTYTAVHLMLCNLNLSVGQRKLQQIRLTLTATRFERIE